MLRRSVIAMFLAMACPAFAAGYDDYMRGVEAMHAPNTDLAIQSFTQALADGDLAATYVPVAHFYRAAAYLAKGQCATALADLDEAIKLKADYLDAVMLRANALRCLDRKDDAVADLNAAVALSPTAVIYRARGQFRWNIGQFADAAGDFAEVARLDHKSAYPVLWFAISVARTGSLDQDKFAKMVSDLDVDDWPMPLLDFFRGRSDPDKVYREAADNATAAADQKCEADFYIAEWRLTHGEVPTAKSLLQQAANECPHNFVEYGAAMTDLRRVP
jgi:lipoprotein NlpI